MRRILNNVLCKALCLALLACATQICGVSVGALLALTLMALHVPSIVGVGIGIMLIITSYHHLKLKLVPVLPCLVLVNVCLNPEVEALSYSMGRIWDTAIGLAIGMAVNTLIFPYDNSLKIRQTMEGLDKDLIEFLEDMFDGDEHLPETDRLEKKIDALEAQLALFSEQRLLRRERQVICGGCGKGFTTSYAEWVQRTNAHKPLLCDDCANTKVTCSRCGESFTENRERVEELRARGVDLLCPDCFDQEFPRTVCESCGQTFRPHQSWLEARRRSGKPIWCKSCAELNKEQGREGEV